MMRSMCKVALVAAGASTNVQASECNSTNSGDNDRCMASSISKEQVLLQRAAGRKGATLQNASRSASLLDEAEAEASSFRPCTNSMVPSRRREQSCSCRRRSGRDNLPSGWTCKGDVIWKVADEEEEEEEEKEEPADSGACLCVFDIDRTLTGAQDQVGKCPRNRMIDGVRDTAYDHVRKERGSQPWLTLSALANEGLSSTFCGKCYIGLCSAGDGGGEGSKERDYLIKHVLRSTPFDELAARDPQAVAWSHGNDVQSPLVYGKGDKTKQDAVVDIRDWYASRGIKIAAQNVHFFGDRTENMEPFRASGFNAREISCGSRDPDLYGGSGMVGFCGALPEEITDEKGIFQCSEAVPEPEEEEKEVEEPCLCIFDIDRTLTGAQDQVGACPRNFMVDGVVDTAYDHVRKERNSQPWLTLSALGHEGIKTTFCGKCYLGLCSAGDAGGKGSKERDYLLKHVLRTDPFDQLVAREPKASDWSHSDHVKSPLVYGKGDKTKQHAVSDVREWYKSLGIYIKRENVYFFGDRTENMEPFRKSGFNSREISCGSRDPVLYGGSGMVGFCGARPEELKPEKGIFQCPEFCDAYMKRKGCSWTKKFSCPGQKKGSRGRAGDDGSEGYNCCCHMELWKGWEPQPQPADVLPAPAPVEEDEEELVEEEEEAAPAAPQELDACLCVFDIDRTLTGAQDQVETCPRNRMIDGVRDTAYDHVRKERGSQPWLTLSALANEGLSSTFCGDCYIGICSAGDAGGDGSKERTFLEEHVLRTGPFDKLAERVPEAKKWSHGNHVHSPFVYGKGDKTKQDAVADIRRWYKGKGVNIAAKNVYFFGDRTENMAPFKESGFNAAEISCGSRDPDLYGGSGMVGFCGATPEEITRTPGISQCPQGSDVSSGEPQGADLPDSQAEKPCLCVFDIDRTLTGAQGQTAACPRNKVIDGVRDTAYDSIRKKRGDEPWLTLSAFAAEGISNTFCGKCYIGICSAGDGGGKGSAERDYLEKHVLRTGPFDELVKKNPDTLYWSHGSHVKSPLVYGKADKTKQDAVKEIKEWYSKQGIEIEATNVFFFGDRTENMGPFLESGFNAREISCASRDTDLYHGSGMVGFCGATPDEIVMKKGVSQCTGLADDAHETAPACMPGIVTRRRRGGRSDDSPMCSCRRRSGSSDLPKGWSCRGNSIKKLKAFEAVQKSIKKVVAARKAN
eukprot:TRINITY_DN4377_c0_g1_i4.p1 TRINITY_DN4377_c0_g1~~TRINITY_DN4377_c0_g1_i4.p1  ORF type:complete len:1192 (+),score=308.84 TRINITY_DN4377_c0_g1_i4:89-3664(+)